jgi:hypothetical protein
MNNFSPRSAPALRRTAPPDIATAGAKNRQRNQEKRTRKKNSSLKLVIAQVIGAGGYAQIKKKEMFFLRRAENTIALCIFTRN